MTRWKKRTRKISPLDCSCDFRYTRMCFTAHWGWHAKDCYYRFVAERKAEREGT